MWCYNNSPVSVVDVDFLSHIPRQAIGKYQRKPVCTYNVVPYSVNHYNSIKTRPICRYMVLMYICVADMISDNTFIHIFIHSLAFRVSALCQTYIYSAKKETHMWFNRNFFRYGVYMTETTIYDWNQQFVRNQNLFVNLLLCETGVCSGPLSATRSITCVATSCFLHCSASAWHGWNQTCNLCMWDVIPGLLDSQTQLWEGLRRWVTWPYASINKVPQMLDRGQVGGICWPGQYLDSISSQKVLCEAGRVRASIILLKR